MIEEVDPIWTLMVRIFMQDYMDNDIIASDDGGEDRQRTQPGLIGPTVGPLLQELVSVRAEGDRRVPSDQQHGLGRRCRQLSCPGRGSQRQVGCVLVVKGGVEVRAKTYSEVDEG